MVYLCAGGRDLSTADGLREAVLSYNDSTGLPACRAGVDGGLRRRPTSPERARCRSSPPSRCRRAALRCPNLRRRPAVAEPSGATPTAATTQARDPGAAPSTTTPGQPATPAPTPAGSTATLTPNAARHTGPDARLDTDLDAGPDAGLRSVGARARTHRIPRPARTPRPARPRAAARPRPSADPTPPPLPECPVPDPEPTAAAEQAEPAPTSRSSHRRPATPPEGYEFDPETGELVPVPARDARAHLTKVDKLNRGA